MRHWCNADGRQVVRSRLRDRRVAVYDRAAAARTAQFRPELFSRLLLLALDASQRGWLQKVPDAYMGVKASKARTSAQPKGTLSTKRGRLSRANGNSSGSSSIFCKFRSADW